VNNIKMPLGDYWTFVLCPWSGILNITKEPDVSVFIREGGRHLFVGSVIKNIYFLMFFRIMDDGQNPKSSNRENPSESKMSLSL
jgi:hypothetical protein